jgi:hypothetical protein
MTSWTCRYFRDTFPFSFGAIYEDLQRFSLLAMPPLREEKIDNLLKFSASAYPSQLGIIYYSNQLLVVGYKVGKGEEIVHTLLSMVIIG